MDSLAIPPNSQVKLRRLVQLESQFSLEGGGTV
jgi:hypothetical protein